MAWNYWNDLAAVTDLNNWQFWRELMLMLREKSAAITGKCYFPRAMTPWADGTITAATETTITDSAATSWVIAGGCTGTSRWVGYECSGSEHVPSHYDVVVELDITDPSKVFRKQISANTSTVLTVESMAINKDVYKQFNSYSDLVGKTYRIIRRGAGSAYPSWHERWINYPNALVDSGSVSSATTTTITDTSKAYATNELTGKDIIYESGGTYYRKSISSNTATVITHSGSTVASGSFVIVEAGSIYLPQSAGTPCLWYGGATKNALSIARDGSVIGAKHPLPSQVISLGQTSCVDETVTLFDVDVFTDFDDQCTPEKSFNPNFYKAPIRATQVYLEGACTYFIDRDTAAGADSIPYLTPATTFLNAGINSATTSDTSSSGDVSFTVSIPSGYSSITLHYALLAPNGDVLSWGTTTTSGTIDLTVPSPAYDDETITLVTSRGWTRKIERAVRYIYPRTYWQPDTNEGGVIYPPNDVSGETGQWITRAADSTYTEFDDYGYPNSGAAFVNGNYVRYLAHANHDGDIAGGSYENLPEDIDYIVWAEEYVPTNTSALELLKSGAAVGGTNRQIKTDKTWFVDGTMRTEMGTATGGSTTTLSDTSKSASNFWVTGRWIGHILSVEISAGVWEKRPITDHSGTTLTVTEAFSVSTNGMAYKIIEPKFVMSRWQGRTVTITHGGTEYTATIAYSDNDTLYLSSALAVTVVEGDRFVINELTPGTVIQRSSGSWIAITNETQKHPTTVTRYGRARMRDFVDKKIFDEIKAFSNELKKTKLEVTWSSREDSGTPENNYLSAYAFQDCYNAEDQAACWATSKTAVEDAWELDPQESASLPHAFTVGSFGADIGNTAAERSYSYASVSGLTTCLDKSVSIWVLADIDQSYLTYLDWDTCGSCDDCAATGTCCDDCISSPECCNCITPGASIVFDNNGDGDFIVRNTWAQFTATTLVASSSSTAKYRVGNNSLPFPAWTSQPPNKVQCQYSDSWRGYFIIDAIAIVDWTMTYID